MAINLTRGLSIAEIIDVIDRVDDEISTEMASIRDLKQEISRKSMNNYASRNFLSDIINKLKLAIENADKNLHSTTGYEKVVGVMRHIFGDTYAPKSSNVHNITEQNHKL